ncbi:MAG TPA: hypothetical protein VFA13_10305 [Candidatus Acidoferrum sp.]|jgi:hypothetical protein|nr:hypothetical protein [Candidatus Acidoferrum sp.]
MGAPLPELKHVAVLRGELRGLDDVTLTELFGVRVRLERNDGYFQAL